MNALTALAQRLWHPARAGNAARDLPAHDDFAHAAPRPAAAAAEAKSQLDAAPVPRPWREALMDAAQGDAKAPLRLVPRIRQAGVQEVEALLSALACASPLQARQMAGLDSCWRVLYPRCTAEQTLRFSRWLRGANPADHSAWALRHLRLLLRDLGQVTKVAPAERAEAVRLYCLTLRLSPLEGSAPCGSAELAGLASTFRARGRCGAPLALYEALCAQLRVPKADRKRLAPWVARLGNRPLPGLDRPWLGEEPLPGALAWEILELVACHLSRFADAPGPTHKLLPCLRAVLAGDLADAEPPPNLALPSGLPQLALRHLSAGLAPGSTQSPAAQRAWLEMLQPHAEGMADDVLLRCASAAQRLGANPWLWVACRTPVHHTAAYDKDHLRAWVAFLAAAPAPPEALPPTVLAVLSRALKDTASPDVNTLLDWVIDHPELHVDVESFFTRPRARLDVADPRTQRQVIILYGRAPRSTQLLAIEHGTLPELLPPLAHTLLAQGWLASGRCSNSNFPRPLKALRAAMTNHPLPRRFEDFPEFVLIETPENLASQGLPPALNVPEWARPMLAGKPPCADADAVYAQHNRLRALGRLLLACRVSQALPERMAALAPLVQCALELPDVRARQALLDLLVARLATEPDNDAAYAEALRLLSTSPAKAQLLQLAALCQAPEWHGDAGAQSLLQARALFNHGEHARSILGLLLDRSGDSSLRPTALRWGNPAKLARMIDSPAQRQRDRDALRAARTALQAGMQMETGHEAARAEASQRQRQALETLRQAQDISATHTEARAHLRDAGAAPAATPTQRREATANLREALTWLLQRPALREALAPVSQVLQLLQLSQLSQPSQLPQHNACANDARWMQARSALKAARNQAPKAEAWLHRYAEGVLLALQSHAPAPSPAQPPRRAPPEAEANVETSVEANSGTNTEANSGTNTEANVETNIEAPAERPSKASLDAAFFAHPKVRAFMVERVLPLALELARYAPLAHAAEVDLASMTDPKEVLPACLTWTNLSAAELQRLDAACPDLDYVAMYAGSLRKRSGPTRQQDEAIVRAVLHASVAGELDAVRRDGPQAKRIVALPGGGGLMAGWERGQRTEATAMGAGWTTQDTGEPGLMLKAVTDIRSCQSARDGEQNRGMLGRLTDGARRMLLLRDARGALRGRAVVRLMIEDERPVLLLSKSYVGMNTDAHQVDSALREHVAQRARALGIRAATPCKSSWDPSNSESVQMLDLVCAGGALDYWDEAGGLHQNAVNLFTDMALLANC